MLLCGASLNGVPCYNHLACPCGVLWWSDIGFRALCLCTIIFKPVFKDFWMQRLKVNLCLKTLNQKDGKALQKFLEFDTSVNILCRFTINRTLCCVPQNGGCLST